VAVIMVVVSVVAECENLILTVFDLLIFKFCGFDMFNLEMMLIGSSSVC